MKSSDYLSSVSCMTFSSTKTKVKSMLNASSLEVIILMHCLSAHIKAAINKNALTQVFLCTMFKFFKASR